MEEDRLNDFRRRIGEILRDKDGSPEACRDYLDQYAAQHGIRRDSGDFVRLSEIAQRGDMCRLVARCYDLEEAAGQWERQSGPALDN